MMLDQFAPELADALLKVAIIDITADLGATFASVAAALPKGQKNGTAALMTNTNATGAGTRLYILVNGAWKYVALT